MSVMKKGREYREQRRISHGRCSSAYLKLETGNTLPNQRDNSKKKKHKNVQSKMDTWGKKWWVTKNMKRYKWF